MLTIKNSNYLHTALQDTIQQRFAQYIAVVSDALSPARVVHTISYNDAVLRIFVIHHH